MMLGRVSFGPAISEAESLSDIQRRMTLSQTVLATEKAQVSICGCVGPQPGETLCPCQLRAESAKGQRMIREGVTVDGVDYDLVPRVKETGV